MPGDTRSAGDEMRDTDRQSIGSSAAMPQPTSQKAPNGSMWVTVQSMMSPGRRRSRYSSQQRFWARVRLSSATGPFGPCVKPVTTKHTGRPTRVSTAMGRTVPSASPSAHSS